jgi:hypothetical protein
LGDVVGFYFSKGMLHFKEAFRMQERSQQLEVCHGQVRVLAAGSNTLAQ